MSQTPYTNYPRGNAMPPRQEINFDTISRAFTLVMANIGPFLAASLICMIVPILVQVGSVILYPPTQDQTVMMAQLGPKLIYSYLIGPGVQVISNGLFFTCMANLVLVTIRTGKGSLNDFFAGLKFAGYGILGALLYQLFIYLGILGCCVGVFFTSTLGMFVYLEIVDNKCTPIEALMASIDRVKAQIWMAVLYFFVIGLLTGAGAIICGVGILFTFGLGQLAIGLTYTDMTGTGPEAMAQQPQPVPGAYVPNPPVEEPRIDDTPPPPTV